MEYVEPNGRPTAQAASGAQEPIVLISQDSFGPEEESKTIAALGPLRMVVVGGNEEFIQELRSSGTGGSTITVTPAQDMTQATRHLEASGADAVLLDVGLVDDGVLSAIETLYERFPEPAIVVLACQEDDESAVAVLKRGAEEYLVRRSVDSGRLLRRVWLAVQRHRTSLDQSAIYVESEAAVDKDVLLLRELLAEAGETLEPQARLDSRIGHSYPKAQNIYESRPGDEIEHLERLAESGCLQKRFFDRIHLCPFCSHFAMNLREVCPRCKSPQLDAVDLLHHYRCAHVAPEPEFREGMRLVCPKCDRELRHVGVDYERPGSHYLCAACQFVTQEPRVACRCLSCGKSSPVELVTWQDVYAYRLTRKGAMAAVQGAIPLPEGARSAQGRALGLYTTAFLEERLIEACEQAVGRRTPVSLLLVRPDHWDRHEREFGREAVGLLLPPLVRRIKELLPRSAVPALFGEATVAALLPGIGKAEAHAVAERILKAVAMLRPGLEPISLRASAGIATSQDGRAPGGDFLPEAVRALDQAASAGGNAVHGVVI